MRPARAANRWVARVALVAVIVGARRALSVGHQVVPLRRAVRCGAARLARGCAAHPLRPRRAVGINKGGVGRGVDAIRVVATRAALARGVARLAPRRLPAGFAKDGARDMRVLAVRAVGDASACVRRRVLRACALHDWKEDLGAPAADRALVLLAAGALRRSRAGARQAVGRARSAFAIRSRVVASRAARDA